MPYLQWQREVHIAKLKASYPEAANKIKTDGASESEDIYARTARVALSQGLPTVQPGDALKSLVTFTRTWLRAWAFSTVENVKTREELKALFPDGCYVAFAGDTYCESRNEVMDDHWRVMHAMPGDGQNRPSMGDSLIQINEQYNTMSNIEAENAEYGIPPTYADSKVVDFDALESQTAEPGSLIPISVRTGMTAEAGFFQPAPGQIPAEISQRKQDLMGPVAQFLTGLFPAVFGGEDPNNQTAAGQTLARDQALGRLGLVWRRLKQFHADIMMLGVDCFRKNRSEDVEMAILGEDDEFESKWLRLDDLKGNIEAYPEGDEQIPRMKSQQRAVLQMLMQSDDPYIRAIFTDPNNSSFISGVFGLTELSMPNEDSRIKQQREIAMMMKGQGPIPPQPTMGAQGPMMGQPQTSVPVDPLLDNHVAEMAEIKRWASSGEGVQARQKNAAQFADITLHYQAHAAAMQAQAPPVQPKPPSVTLALKGTDITPEGVAQVAEQEFGVKITPQDVVQAQALDVAKETAIKSSDFGGEQTPRPSGKTGKS